MSTNPIGIFDSGIGGTSIFKEIHALMPYENSIYLADSANAPYGNKSKKEILQLTAIKPASLNTKTKSIGILATKGTLSSALFHKTTDLYANCVSIIEKEGEGIVTLIEEGKLYSIKMYELLEKYTKPMLDANIDYLVLGCTHYPYLTPILSKMLPEHIKIIDSGFAVAQQTKSVLKQNSLLNVLNKKSDILFYTNTTTNVLKEVLNQEFNVEYLDF